MPHEKMRTERDLKLPGLHLRHGKRTSVWYLYYRLDGKEHRPKIGDARIISRQQARNIAMQWLANVAQGKPHADAQDAARQAAHIAGEAIKKARI